MEWYEIVLFIFILIGMLIGMFGTILPIIPGTPLIFGLALLYALIEGFNALPGRVLLILLGLTLLAQLLEYLSTVFGIRRMGGSYFGVLGAVAGLVAGFFSGAGIIGIIIGPIIGAFLFEIIAGKDSKQAMRAGIGSFFGFLLGGVLKFALAGVMIGIFVWHAVIK